MIRVLIFVILTTVLSSCWNPSQSDYVYVKRHEYDSRVYIGKILTQKIGSGIYVVRLCGGTTITAQYTDIMPAPEGEICNNE